MTAHIECADLVRIFSAEGVEVQALQGLTLSVGRGELTAIVGASGSGKSTLLAILSGLDVPTAGTASVAGHDLLTMSTRERTRYRRHTVNFVWQQTARNLLPYLSAAENIAMSLSVARTPARSRAPRIADLLELLGSGPLRDRLPAQMSGEQQQRVAIAVALANEPEVIFADEPTGELDEGNSQLVFDAMRSVNKSFGVTVVIVMLDQEVSAQVRRTVQIRDGRTSTEVLRRTETDRFGVASHLAQEYAVLDKVGRLQLPEDYLVRLSMRDRVRLELEQNHVAVNPTTPDEASEAELVEMRRNELGYIFQTFALLPVLSAAENIELPMRIVDVPAAERDARVRGLLETVGLAQHRNQRPNELSGGQQQRLGIARALANDPRLLIADEPTGQLDSTNADAMMSMIAGLVQERGVAAIVSTHDPRMAAYAYRIIEIHDGHVGRRRGRHVSDDEPDTPRVGTRRVESATEADPSGA